MADNNTYGRILSCKIEEKKVLRKQPGICQKRLEEVKQSEEMMTYWEKVIMYLKADNDPWMRTDIEIQKSLARKFESRCQQMPDEIPDSKLEELRLELESEFRKEPMNPERTLELRSQIAELSSIYLPGPQAGATLTEPEIDWLRSKNLKFTNDLNIALLGPIFGAPGFATETLGGSPDLVNAVNEVSATAFNVAMTRNGIPEKDVGFSKSIVDLVERIGNPGRQSGPISKTSREGVVIENRLLTIQRRLANITKETRDLFIRDSKLLERYLSPKEIDAIVDAPWRMRLFFGTALERRVAEIATKDDILSSLRHTINNAPQDFIEPGELEDDSKGWGYEITGSSYSSIMSHMNRPGVDAIVTYDSIPSDFGYKWIQDIKDR